VIGADQGARHVRDDQADPPDDAGGRDHAGGYEGDGAEDRPLHQLDGRAQRARLVLAQREDVDLVAQQDDQDRRGQDRHRHQREVAVAGGGDAAHQPVGDGRQLLMRIGQQLDNGNGRFGEGRDDHARQHERQRRGAPLHAGEELHHQEAADAEGEGGPDDDIAAADQQDRERAAEAGAGGHADDAGIDQWIAEQTLQGGAGDGEPGPDQ
jgi:hypothetical protein